MELVPTESEPGMTQGVTLARVAVGRPTAGNAGIFA